MHKKEKKICGSVAQFFSKNASCLMKHKAAQPVIKATFSIFGCILFWKISKKFPCLPLIEKFEHWYTMDHALNKYESSPPEDALTQVSVFQANWFLMKILKDLFCIYLC